MKKNTILKSALLVASIAVAGTSLAQEITNVNVRTYRGEPYGVMSYEQPRLGETTRFHVTYSVYTSNETFNVVLKIGDKKITKQIDHEYPGNYDAFFDAKVPVDGGYSVTAVIDPENHIGEDPTTRWDNSKTITVTPIAQAATIQYYDQKRYKGIMQASAYFTKTNNTNLIAWMMAKPSSETSQIVDAADALVNMPGGSTITMPSVVANGSGLPIFFQDKSNAPSGATSVTQFYWVRVSNVCVNKANIENKTWAQVDALQGLNIFKYYTLPQASTQSTSATIKNYVESTLGANYRTTMTPYNAARTMFKRILKDTVYYHASDQPWDAISVLQQGRGDCAGFSLLIQACFRHMGIPTRIVYGIWANSDTSTHIWNEFYIPGAGWLICDGSAGNGWSENGSTAFCFGNLTDLNARMIHGRTIDFTYGKYSASWLQMPQLPRANGTISSYKWSATMDPMP